MGGAAGPGAPGGWGGPLPAGGPPQVRHLPGMGAIVAVVGLLIFLVSVASLPWARVGGEDVTRSDVVDAYEYEQENDLDDVDYVGEYATSWWMLVAGVLALAVLFSTLVVPPSKAGRMVTGFVLGSLVGLAVNAADNDGRVGPRISAALAIFGAAAVHGLAQFLLLGDLQDPDVGIGIWGSVVGLAVMLTGCSLGTRTVQAPAAGLPAPAPGYGYTHR
jgi:hypothetical protein